MQIQPESHNAFTLIMDDGTRYVLSESEHGGKSVLDLNLDIDEREKGYKFTVSTLSFDLIPGNFVPQFTDTWIQIESKGK